MKNGAILILTIAAVVFGALFVRELDKRRQSDATLAALQQKADELEGRLAEDDLRLSSLQKRLSNTRDRVEARAEEVSQLQQAITNRDAESKTNNPLAQMLKGVGEMFKNPEMKDYVRNQQKTVLSGMLEKNYGPFFTLAGLTAEQSAALKDLVLNRSLVDAGAGMSVLSASDPTNRAQILEDAKTEKSAVEDQIKKMLGDATYQQFQNYEKTIPDRTVVGMFKDQQASGPIALSPDQEALLVQVMGDERQNFKFTTDFSDQTKMTSDLAGNLTEEKVNQFLQEQEQLNQRYLSRAQTVLSADQVGSFGQFLTNQLGMQKLGLKMASKMFAPK